MRNAPRTDNRDLARWAARDALADANADVGTVEAAFGSAGRRVRRLGKH